MGLFDDVLQKQPTQTTQPQRGGLFDDVVATSQGSATPSIQTKKKDKPSVLGAIGGGVKEIVKAPFAVAAFPFALSQETLRQFQGKTEPTRLGKFVFGETKPFTRERAAKGFERTLDAATLGVLGAGVTAGKVILKKGVTQAAKTAAKKRLAKTVITDAAIGGGYGASFAFQEEDPAATSVLAQTGAGMILGAILPPALGKTLGLGIKGGKVISKAIGEGIETTAARLEKKVAGKIAKQADDGFLFTKPTDAPLNFRTYIAKRTAEELRKLQGLPFKAMTRLLDKFYGATVLEQKFIKAGVNVMKRVGISVPLIEKFQRAQTAAAGTANQRLIGYVRGGIGIFKENWRLVKENARFLNEFDLLKEGIPTESGKTIEELTSAYNKFQAALTPEQKKIVNKGMLHIQKFMRAILKEALMVRRISPFEYKKIIDANPNYIPHIVLDFLEDSEKTILPRKFTGRGVKLKARKGSGREIADVDEAIEEYVFKQTYLNKKQEAMNAMFDLIESDPKLIGARVLQSAKQQKERIELLTILKEQIKLGREELRALRSAGQRKGQLSDEIKHLESALAKLENETVSILKLVHPDEKFRNEFVGDIISVVGEKTTRLSKEYFSNFDILIRNLKTRIEKIKKIKKVLHGQLKQTAKEKLKTVDVPDGFAKVSRLKDGFLEEWVVPDYVAVAMNGFDEKTAGLIGDLSRTLFKPLELAARFTRAVATSRNPFFILTNLPRDVETSLVTSHPDSFFKAFSGLGRSMWEVFHKNNPELAKSYRLAEKQGVFFSGILREEKQLGSSFRRILVEEGLVQKTIKEKLATPMRVMEDFIAISEEGVRLNVFQQALIRGLTPDQAAREAAQATVDFGRSGTWLQFINRYVPFLNARVQGAANLVRVLEKNPEEFTRRVFFTAVYPSIGLNIWNSQFEAYYNIPLKERQMNFIIMAGQNRGRDYNNKPILIPHYVKIPKGEAQQIAGLLVDRMIDVSREQNPEGTAHFLGRMVSGVSPIAEGQIFPLPEGRKQMTELQLNRSFFTGKDIVPTWVKTSAGWKKSDELEPRFQFTEQNTSEVAQLLGNALNWSPEKIDHVIKTGIINDLVRTMDLGIRPLIGTTESFKRAEKQEPFFEEVAQAPGIRRLIGASPFGAIEKQQRLEREREREKNRRKLERTTKRTGGLF